MSNEPMLKESRPLFRLRNYIFDLWYEDKSYFLGKVLTIIDASIPDAEQRKGIKDLIHNAYNPERINYRDQELRTILLDFAEHFVPKIMPKSHDEELSFKGQIKESERSEQPDYWN